MRGMARTAGGARIGSRPMTLLALDGVCFAYGAHEVLRGVSCRLGRGERVALLGPNGAGKSTLLKVAAGSLLPQSGTVLLEGTPLARLPRALAAQCIGGVAAAEAAEFPFLVRESVALGRHPWRSAFGPPRAQDEAAVEAALEACDLRALAGRPVPSLSSGERQRVALARALAQQADVLLLDEPTAHLDLGHQQRLLAAVGREASTRGVAVLAALHDVNLAAAWADRVLLLVDGRLVGDGTPGEVLTAARVEAAFGAPVHVLAHPDGGGPLLVPRGCA
ncbi:MAG: ABC transporter ATP-binding protein [Planctomycetia bacterium]